MATKPIASGLTGIKSFLLALLLTLPCGTIRGSLTGWRPVDGTGQLAGPAEHSPVLKLEAAPGGGGPNWDGGYCREIEVEDGTVAWRLKLEARAPEATRGTYANTIRLDLTTSPGARPFFLCGPVLDKEWQTYEAVAVFPEGEPPARIYLAIGSGWGDSVTEVRHVSVEALSQRPDPQSIRRKGVWYTGQQAEANWREKAREMIEMHRMASVRVKVVNSDGSPVKGARVVLEQQSHAYKFGTAVSTQLFRWMKDDASDPTRESLLLGGDAPVKTVKRVEAEANARRYFSEIVANFNYYVVENGLKAQAWAGDWAGFRTEDTLASMDWLSSRGLEAKGHVLVWPGWRHSPEYMKEARNDPEALASLIDAHIADMGSAMNGKVAAFDVLNEAYNNNDFMRILGDEVMSGWFKQADQFLPDARLCLNDFLIIANGGRWSAKLDFYDQLVATLLEEDAPLDVVGFQNHYRHNFLTGPERIWELCDRFGRHGLPLECSEFDVLMEDEELQAAYTRDFLTAWFAHPSTSAFLFWGFWESAHWLPQAALLTSDWREKPNYHAYRDLVFKEWWTGWEETETGADGYSIQRGFHGTYWITVTHKGHSRTLRNIALGNGGLELVVRL